jgi:hypothetical protein
MPPSLILPHWRSSAPAQAGAERLGLLEDLLEHVVLEAAQLDLLQRELDLLEILGDVDVVDGLGVEARPDRPPSRCRTGRSPGSCARRWPRRPRPGCTRRLPTPRISGLPRLAPMSSPVPHAPAIVVAVQIADQVRDDLRIGLTEERDAFASQPGLERAVVLDDPVVYDGDLAGVVGVRVGVDRVRLAVRRPAGVSDPQGVDAPGPVQDLLQGTDPAAGLLDAQAAVPQQRDTRRVVAPVLQPLETFDEDRLSGFTSQICNNTTHKHLL